MTSPHDSPPREQRPPGTVVRSDGSWEVALRAGQEAEGHRGSVEPELAVLHLLRHAREPEDLSNARQDAIWSALDDAVVAAEHEAAPEPWWKRPWSWVGGAAAAAAAAAVVLVVVLPDGGPPPEGPAVAHREVARTSLAEQVEKQFEILAPKARAQVEREADDSRDSLRGDLLSDALGASDGEMEDAP